MARSTRSANLETRTARLKLPVEKKPVFVRIGLGLGLGYRRNKTSGSWVARVADGKGSNWTKVIGEADDYQDADGDSVLDFWQAQARVRSIARASQSGSDHVGKLPTIEEALNRYEADLRTRGGDPGNVTRVRVHLSPALAKKSVALATTRDFRYWRDDLAKGVVAATVNRTARAFKAALNLAADGDERIPGRRPWEVGLAPLPNAEEARNVILPEPDVRRLISEAYRLGQEFGLLVELAAITGARYSQLARLEVQDLQGDRATPRLMMPSSYKGHGMKKVMRRPVPIPEGLLPRLRVTIANKLGNAPMLEKPTGGPWERSGHYWLFKKAVKGAGLNPSEVTIYALRHSNIVRQLLAGVPIRVVAANHDTSTIMIESTYSRFIGDHADALARSSLLDTTAQQSIGNVVPIEAAR